jgi:hypothetical protein
MTRWFPTVALTALLSPLALCDDGAESARPFAKPCNPAKCCASKTDQAVQSAAKPSRMARAVPEDERQAYLELLDIIRTTESPDTFTAAVAGLLGADSAVEKRYARLAVPVVIRNAERLGLLKGIASVEEPTPAQAELLDYLEGAAAETAPPAQAMAANYAVPLRWRSYLAANMYSSTPPAMPAAAPVPCSIGPCPMPAPGSFAAPVPCSTAPSTIPAAVQEPVPPTMNPAVEGHSRPATEPATVIPTPPGAIPPQDSPPAPPPPGAS